MTCEPGTFSAYTEQTRIFNGEAITERFQVCKPCLIGSYEPRVGSSMCIPCPQFHTTPSTGMTSATECVGKLSNMLLARTYIGAVDSREFVLNNTL